MCTVSFLPAGQGNFILTSNRDEAIARGLASVPVVIEKNNYSLICPVDPLASGTWIAASDYGDVICLLNGAFQKHKHQPPYRKSRGLVVLDYFETGNPEKFAATYDLENIEPFTMVMVHRGKSSNLFELRWDGNQKFFKPLDPNEFHLWSSATLYDDVVADEKMKAFKKILEQQKEIAPDNMIDIHQQFLYEDWVKPPVRVDVVSTLSVTSVESNSKSIDMYYRDLVRKEIPLAFLSLNVNQENS